MALGNLALGILALGILAHWVFWNWVLWHWVLWYWVYCPDTVRFICLLIVIDVSTGCRLIKGCKKGSPILDSCIMLNKCQLSSTLHDFFH